MWRLKSRLGEIHADFQPPQAPGIGVKRSGAKPGRKEIGVPPHVGFCYDWKDAKIAGCDRQQIGIAQKTLEVVVLQQQGSRNQIVGTARLGWIDSIASTCFDDWNC